MAKLPMKDVVVLLPGITGSRLVKDGKEVWDVSAGAVGRALFSLGGSITRLALNGDDPDAEYLDDGVREAGLLPDLHFLPGMDWRIDGYGKVAQRLRSWFDLLPGENYFEFAYDWRRDNRAHAKRLRRQSRIWLRDWRDRTGNQDAKLVLVGHSMGGLISRWFLECEDGWRDTRTLITFGTPYSGSLNALDGLVNGQVKKLGPITLIDLTETMRSFPSAYQLLPTFRCIDTGGEELVRLRDRPRPEGWRQDAWAAALALHDGITAAVKEHQASDYEGTGGYDIRPIVGEFQPTYQSAEPAGALLRMLGTWDGSDRGGDGTVPGLSSYPRELYERRENVTFIAQKHASLQNDDGVLTQLYGLLRGQPIPPEQYYAAVGRVALDLPLAFAAGEPLRFSIRTDQAGSDLEVTVVDPAKGVVVDRVMAPGVEEGWTTVELPPPPAGDYRVTVGGPDVAPVTDICTVVTEGASEPAEDAAVTPSG